MIYNKQMVSNARETREQQLSDRNPLYRISALINAYHSLDLRPISEETKAYFRGEIDREVKRQLKYVSTDIHSQLKISLKNKDYWEAFRNRII